MTITRLPQGSRYRLSGSKRHWKSRATAHFSTAKSIRSSTPRTRRFLQRYFFLDRVRKLGQIENYPRLKAWGEALMKRPSTHSFPQAEFEAMYREGLRRRNKWVSRFIEPERAAAE